MAIDPACRYEDSEGDCLLMGDACHGVALLEDGKCLWRKRYGQEKKVQDKQEREAAKPKRVPVDTLKINKMMTQAEMDLATGGPVLAIHQKRAAEELGAVLVERVLKTKEECFLKITDEFIQVPEMGAYRYTLKAEIYKMEVPEE